MFIEDPDTDKIGTHAHVLDKCATALAYAGYRIIDSNNKDSITIRRVCASAFEIDYEVTVKEILP